MTDRSASIANQLAAAQGIVKRHPTDGIGSRDRDAQPDATAAGTD
jgi:hypothetical protein